MIKTGTGLTIPKEIKLYDRWLNIKDACKYSSLSQSTLRRSYKRGLLKGSNRTGRLLFKISNIDMWLNGE